MTSHSLYYSLKLYKTLVQFIQKFKNSPIWPLKHLQDISAERRYLLQHGSLSAVYVLKRQTLQIVPFTFMPGLLDTWLTDLIEWRLQFTRPHTTQCISSGLRLYPHVAHHAEGCSYTTASKANAMRLTWKSPICRVSKLWHYRNTSGLDFCDGQKVVVRFWI